LTGRCFGSRLLEFEVDGILAVVGNVKMADEAREILWMDVGWKTEKPEIVKRCEAMGHTPCQGNDEKKCVSLVWCDICGYGFRIDYP